MPREYFDDPYTLNFRSRVASQREDDEGIWVRLEETLFYPEGGGQSPDRGTLSGVEVLDVQSDQEGLIWHRVSAAVPEEIEGEIAGPFRSANRQQHSGQHILSQAFVQTMGAETTASHIGSGLGTVDLACRSLSIEEMEGVENLANQIVWENREIRSHLIDSSEIGRFSLSRELKGQGLVRLIEIEDWDTQPCGGTHCQRTGEVGLIKIKKSEKFRDGMRVYFVCGTRAFEDYQRKHRDLMEAGRRRNTGEDEILETLEKAASERDLLRKQQKRISNKLMQVRSAELAGHHLESGAPLLVHREPDAAMESLRNLAGKLIEAGVPRVLLSSETPDPILVAARSKDLTDPDLRQLASELARNHQGKGGGNPEFIQISFEETGSLRSALQIVKDFMAGESG